MLILITYHNTMYENNIKDVVKDIIINEFGHEFSNTITFTDEEYVLFNEIPGNIDDINLKLKVSFVDDLKKFIDDNKADDVIDKLDFVVDALQDNYKCWPINPNENYFGSTSHFSIVKNRVMKNVNLKLLNDDNNFII